MVKIIHVDRPQITEQHHENCQPYRWFRCCNGQNKKHKNLPGRITKVVRKCNEIHIYRKQHEFDRHEQNDDVFPIEENAHYADRKQDRAKNQIVW